MVEAILLDIKDQLKVIVKKEYSKHETLLSNQKAKNILGFEPQYSWRRLAK